MNAKRMSLALATLALLSTGSAFAQSVDVNAGPVGASVDVGGAVAAPVAATSAIVAAPLGVASEVARMPGRLVKGIFNPPDGWFDLRVLGAGITIGGPSRTVQVSSTPSAMLIPSATTTLVGSTQVRTLEMARVIPGSVSLGAAVPVSASMEGPKPLFHIDLFGNRLIRMGSVAPSLDMRDK